MWICNTLCGLTFNGNPIRAHTGASHLDRKPQEEIFRITHEGAYTFTHAESLCLPELESCSEQWGSMSLHSPNVWNSGRHITQSPTYPHLDYALTRVHAPIKDIICTLLSILVVAPGHPDPAKGMLGLCVEVRSGCRSDCL